ncbi:hypothetical protein, partial [Shewanella sp.]|uniref:hypothetical protein n=1 Tax=Shewanella sp. TaxID=50422 RepID=UPI00404871AF
GFRFSIRSKETPGSLIKALRDDERKDKATQKKQAKLTTRLFWLRQLLCYSDNAQLLRHSGNAFKAGIQVLILGF